MWKEQLVCHASSPSVAQAVCACNLTNEVPIKGDVMQKCHKDRRSEEEREEVERRIGGEVQRWRGEDWIKDHLGFCNYSSLSSHFLLLQSQPITRLALLSRPEKMIWRQPQRKKNLKKTLLLTALGCFLYHLLGCDNYYMYQEFVKRVCSHETIISHCAKMMYFIDASLMDLCVLFYASAVVPFTLWQLPYFYQMSLGEDTKVKVSNVSVCMCSTFATAKCWGSFGVAVSIKSERFLPLWCVIQDLQEVARSQTVKKVCHCTEKYWPD